MLYWLSIAMSVFLAISASGECLKKSSSCNVLSDGDIIVPQGSTTTNFGKNAGDTNQFIGVPKIGLASLGTLNANFATNGDQILIMDDSPAGECAPIGGGSEADDSSIYRTGSNSYKHTFDSSVAAGEGVDCTTGGINDAAIVSVGFWLRSSVSFDADDLEVVLDDGGVAEATENIGTAYNVPGEWVWFEVNVTTDCAITCDNIDGVFIQTTASDPTRFNGAVLNIDSGAYWIAGAEFAIGAGKDVLVDGMLSVFTFPLASGVAAVFTDLVEWTDFAVNYQSGNDVILFFTDQSGLIGLAIYAENE